MEQHCFSFESIPSVLCKCGCGKEVKINKHGLHNEFISGHNKPRQKPPVYFTCKKCGVQTKVYPYQANRSFCSTKCRDSFRKERASEDHPQYKRIEQVCGICSKVFIIAPARVKRGIRYCSHECGNEARARRLRKEEGHKKSNILRERVANRDNNKCKICDFDHIVHVHHITPKKEGGIHSFGNLITLCPNHHAMVHAGLIERSKLIDLIKQ